jgi:hypothetical protein
MLQKAASFRTISVLLLIFLATLDARAQTPLKSTDHAPGSWTLVLLPDTQIYSQTYPGLFTLQTHWIAKNKKKFDIRCVIGLGDITNKHTEREWQHARDAMSELDGVVPYALATGNHDYQSFKGDRKTLFAKYFPLETFQKMSTFGGAMNGDTANTYHLFAAGGTEWILFALEWAPRNETVQWANDVLAKHPKRKAILATHAYLYNDDTRYDYARKKNSQSWNPHQYDPDGPINDGEELWRKLVNKNDFVLTFNGHVLGSGLGFLASKNDRGRLVHQMLVNYQMRPLGGEAYLRLLEFLPDGKTVHVKSYSPLYDTYLEEPGQQFSFESDR